MYHCEFANESQLIRHLRVHCIARGYRFYVTGTIPAHKDPAKTDQKIISQYGIDISKWARGRRKKRGLANVHYLRCGHAFIIVATRGAHSFFIEEKNAIRDVGRVPVILMGHRIGCGRRRPNRGIRT